MSFFPGEPALSPPHFPRQYRPLRPFRPVSCLVPWLPLTLSLAQILTTFSTAAGSWTHRNAHNSILLMRLLHGSRDTPGGATSLKWIPRIFSLSWSIGTSMLRFFRPRAHETRSAPLASHAVQVVPCDGSYRTKYREMQNGGVCAYVCECLSRSGPGFGC